MFRLIFLAHEQKSKKEVSSHFYTMNIIPLTFKGSGTRTLSDVRCDGNVKHTVANCNTEVGK